jgi:DNA-binding protein Fis
MNSVATNAGPDAPAQQRDLPDLRSYTEQLLASGTQDLYRVLLGTVDRVALAAVLRHVGGTQVRASEVLGISRTTLRGKLRAAGLSADGRRKNSGDPHAGGNGIHLPATNGTVSGHGNPQPTGHQA